MWCVLCLLFAGCCLLFVVRCLPLLFVVYMFVVCVCCLLGVGCCVLLVDCWMSSVVFCCSLLVVLRRLFDCSRVCFVSWLFVVRCC